MSRSRQPVVPVVGTIDLDFRPVSYWEAAGPVEAILQNIKGQNRRRIVEDHITGRASASMGELESLWFDDELEDADRNTLGAIDPSFMGGEFLPGYGRGEVEIARVIMASTTQDVYSLRARRRGGRIGYRLLDEYDTKWVLTRQSSTRPLSLRELIHLIDSADYSAGDEAPTLPLLETILSFQLDGGGDRETAARFIEVTSTVYPELGDYYWARLQGWVATYGQDQDVGEVSG